jgi:hypothetical protein
LALPDAELAATIMLGTTNQYGYYTSETLRPGKYWIIATTHTNAKYVDSVTRLLRNRPMAKEVVVAPGNNREIVIEPIDLVAR